MSVEQQLAKLDALVEEVSGKKTNLITIAVLIPFISAGLFFMTDPKFLRTRTGEDSSERNIPKYVVWTLLLSSLAWGGLYWYWTAIDE